MSLFKYSAPSSFYPLAGKLVPWFGALAFLLAVGGLYLGLFVAPEDYQQGEVYRIIFIHVPSAWMGMFIYLVMAMYALLALVYQTRLSAMMMEALAPTGMMFTAIALWTGALWGKPTWGTYWAFDARMTSTLILLFLYIGYMALVNAIEDKKRADKAGALLVLVGSINVPIIYFSVKWWNTLHQGASVSLTQGNKMAATMLAGMLIMALACWMYSIAVALCRVRAIILEREPHAAWVKSIREVQT
ncbi:MAG: heme ABC transporter permease CcmC [Burkholderiales bacterium]|jgi:heme exporter protein C|nr:heme ABC transporter permease CcmC [Betaproteobacteria bacterium]